MASQSNVSQLLNFVQQSECLNSAYPVLFGWLLRNQNYLLSSDMTDNNLEIVFSGLNALNAMFVSGNFSGSDVRSIWENIFMSGFNTSWTLNDADGYFIMNGPPFALYIGYESADKILQVFSSSGVAGTPIGVLTKVLYTSPSQGYNNQEVFEVDFGGVFTWIKMRP